MKIIFLGVGEAFDENLANSSVLVLSDNTNLLLDCGCSIPQQLWRFNKDQSFLDAVYISHTHADHYFGIPSLFYRMHQRKREKPLTVIGQKGIEKLIKELMEFAYKDIFSKFEFKIDFIEVEQGQTIQFNELKLSFAETEHSIDNLALKIDNGEKSFCYSGDGMFNIKTEELYKNSDLVIHEAYLLNEKEEGHACITDLIEMAERNNVKCLAFIHISRDIRKEKLESIKKMIFNKKVKVLVPNPLEEYEL